MKARLAAIAVAAAAAVVAVSGCDDATPSDPGSSVCVTAAGHIRVPDFRCEGASMAYDWWFLAPGVLAPVIGQRATVGSLTRPAGARLGGVPATPTTTKAKPKTQTTAKREQATPKPAKPAAPKPKPVAPKVRTR